MVVPPALDLEQRAELKAAVPGSPSQAGIDLSNWNWKVVRRYVEERFGLTLSRSPPVADLNYLHRLGFVLKHPKKRWLKADPVRRKVFLSEYAVPTAAARRTGAKAFFADEAHFRADADLRGMWVLNGEPALVDSTNPRRGEKASYDSAVCLETGDVEVMELEGNSNSVTSAAFLKQLRAQHPEPLTVIWDNSPSHRGDALRAYLATLDLNLHLVNLPSYSPDFNAPILDQSGHLRLGPSGGDCQPVLGHTYRGAGQGGRLFHPPAQPTRSSQTPLPYRTASTSGRTDRQRAGETLLSRVNHSCRFIVD
ncbi:MAG: IS630 family transposase [Chloroflexi bacterium]|nr:IS630 family transposase [Chloroflexota bacterium]